MKMSYTTIMEIYPNEKVECGERVRNSWGSAPAIWDFLSHKYLHLPRHAYFCNIEKLWPLWKNKRIPKCYRAVLLFTFDKIYVRKENYRRIVADIRKFSNVHDKEVVNTINTWPSIADIIETSDAPAIGLWCTSVSNNPFSGKWNEEKDEYDPINWDELHEIYDVLDGLNNIKK